MKGGFNLSRWALEHIALTRYLMAALLLGGIISYMNLGQDEDPAFTFRMMAIMGGLVVATAPTLLFLPALYAFWFRVKKPLPGISALDQNSVFMT